jgi:hypothetical protein
MATYKMRCTNLAMLMVCVSSAYAMPVMDTLDMFSEAKASATHLLTNATASTLAL